MKLEVGKWMSSNKLKSN